MDKIKNIIGWGATAVVGLLVVVMIGEKIYFSYFYDDAPKVQKQANKTANTAPTPEPQAQDQNRSNLIAQEGGIALYSTDRADKWLVTFEEPIFGNWLFGRPQMKRNSAGTTEIIGYGPPQQGEMYFQSAVSYDALLKLREAYTRAEDGTRAESRAYEALNAFEKSERRYSDIYDDDLQEYVSYKWAAYEFTADELLRRHSRNVVKDWLCYYNQNYKMNLLEWSSVFDCRAFVHVESCGAPQVRWNADSDWEQLECNSRDYVPIGKDFSIFQSSNTRYHNQENWADGTIYKGDYVIFSGLMDCLDPDYKKCHVRATDIKVIPSE